MSFGESEEKMRFSPTLKAAIDLLDDRGIPFMLAHEAAISGWYLDVNLTLKAIDVLVDTSSLSGLPPSAARSDGAYRTIAISGGGVIRLWDRIGPFAYGDAPRVDAPLYGCLALDPYAVLETMPLSPDYRYLLEQRALLAEVLFFDMLDDEHLGLFHRYVRGG